MIGVHRILPIEYSINYHLKYNGFTPLTLSLWRYMTRSSAKKLKSTVSLTSVNINQFTLTRDVSHQTCFWVKPLDCSNIVVPETVPCTRIPGPGTVMGIVQRLEPFHLICWNL